jgi:hypothetical protein
LPFTFSREHSRTPDKLPLALAQPVGAAKVAADIVDQVFEAPGCGRAAVRERQELRTVADAAAAGRQSSRGWRGSFRVEADTFWSERRGEKARAEACTVLSGADRMTGHGQCLLGILSGLSSGTRADILQYKADILADKADRFFCPRYMLMYIVQYKADILICPLYGCLHGHAKLSQMATRLFAMSISVPRLNALSLEFLSSEVLIPFRYA